MGAFGKRTPQHDHLLIPYATHRRRSWNSSRYCPPHSKRNGDLWNKSDALDGGIGTRSTLYPHTRLSADQPDHHFNPRPADIATMVEELPRRSLPLCPRQTLAICSRSHHRPAERDPLGKPSHIEPIPHQLAPRIPRP